MANELTPCDRNIYKTGHLVMMTHSIPSKQLEEWVKKVAALSSQKVDWHFAGGRACVLASGDLGAVYKAIEQLMPEHNEMQSKEHFKHFPDWPFTRSCAVYDENEINTAHELARHLNSSLPQETPAP